MSEAQTEPVVNITNNEKVEVNGTVNKKLSEMSKEAKTRKKKRLQKPKETTNTTVATGVSLTNNQMYMLLAVIGVIIAGASLYYQRKSVVKDEKPKVELPAKPKTPEPVLVDLTPGMYSF